MKTPMELSRLAWIGGGLVGGIAGGVAKKDHRVLGTIGGALLGAILVGAVADKLIERDYAPKWRIAKERELLFALP